jgi:hypothetical protein
MAMVHQVVWTKMNVFDADGTATILNRGDYVPDGVDAGQLGVLMNIGAVVARETVEVPEPADAVTPDEDDLLLKPAPGDSKEAWVAYASDERNAKRLTRSEADNMSKTALMDRFKG